MIYFVFFPKLLNVFYVFLVRDSSFNNMLGNQEVDITLLVQHTSTIPVIVGSRRTHERYVCVLLRGIHQIIDEVYNHFR